MIDHLEAGDQAALVVCDNCKKRLCVLADYDWQLVGCALQDSNGIRHFCSKQCLKTWLDTKLEVVNHD